MSVHPCRNCGAELKTVFADLGIQPPSNSYLTSAESIALERKYPLRAKVCDTCMLVQIDHDVPPDELFSNYSYFSSYSDSWLAHAKRYCTMAKERFNLDLSSLVVELASNDGYLLRNFVEAGIPVLGIEPSDTVAAAAERIGVPTLVEFFGKAVAARLSAEGRQADLIIGNNVLAHVPALNDFIAGMVTLLKPGGTVTLEFPHLLHLMELNEFDTIYHEHFSYFSLFAVEKAFARHELRIFDIDELSTHGGSLRIYGCHATRTDVHEGTGLLKVRAAEQKARLDDLVTYQSFAQKLPACRRSLLAFLAEAQAAGKTVAAYGAAAKGNTLLNYCGVTTTHIAMVADRNPHKQNKLLPGSHIPIVAPGALLAARPDYVLILPWNIRDEVMSQLTGVLEWGGKFVTAIPVVTVHG